MTSLTHTAGGAAAGPATAPAPSPMPFRLAAATTACTLFLVLFGGAITTMGAGMAVKGWMDAEGHFMPLFPLEKWFRDHATFVEHTHRMIGIVVGLLAIATVVATFRTRSWPSPGRQRLARAASVAALVAICLQGALGGSRVLENSQGLAFLHGAAGQLVFLILWCTTVVLMPAFQRAPALAPERAEPLVRRGTAAVLVVYGQIVLGALFRHAYRVSTEVAGADDLPFPTFKFMLHGSGALAVLLVVLITAKATRDVWEAAPEGSCVRALYRKLELLIWFTFLVQILLGTGALGMLSMERTALPVVLTSTLHVLFGALVLSAVATAALWGRAGLAAVPSVEGASGTGGGAS